MHRLDGKVALITGAGGGVGRAAALLFAQEGARIAMTDIAEDNLNETARQLEDVSSEVLSIMGDIVDTATIDRLASSAVERWGGIDVLANIAAIQIGASYDAYTKEDFDALMAVNCRAPFQAIQRVVPEMKRSGGGSIVNVSSIGALAGYAHGAAYCASKAALVGLTRSIAFDVAEDVRCNAICPGAIDTPMARQLLTSFPEEEREAAWATFTARQLMKRFASPSEIAAVIAFLGSDESSFMTGAIVPVEAGWTAW